MDTGKKQETELDLLHYAKKLTTEGIACAAKATNCIDPLKAHGIQLPLMRALQQLRTAADLIGEKITEIEG